jgi:pilus assembly protein CpaB
MRPKSLILLSLALGCGLVASVGINQVMSKGSPVVQPQSEKVAVFVAKKEIAMNDLIAPDMLTTKQLPKDVVPQGAIKELKDIEDRRAATRIIVDDILLEPKLLAKGEKGRGSDHIPPGMRSVAIKVDATSTSGFLVKPGDHVDLMVYLRKNGANGVHNTMIKTFLQNVKVFAADNVLTESPDGKGQKTIKTISLLVTPEQAEVVTIAASLGKITLSLRSPKDGDVSENLSPTLLRKLFEESDGSEKKTEEKPQPTFPVAKEEPKPKPGLLAGIDWMKMLPKLDNSKKEHVIEIYAGAEVTRWKTIEGNPNPVKVTDGPPADVALPQDTDVQPAPPSVKEVPEVKPEPKETPKDNKGGDGGTHEEDEA